METCAAYKLRNINTMSEEPVSKRVIFWIIVASVIAVLPWIVLATGLTD